MPSLRSSTSAALPQRMVSGENGSVKGIPASFEAVGLPRLTVEGGTRMGIHRNARLGLAGRRQLVADVEAGCSCREAARRRGVSPTTACKWWRRWSEARVEQRLTLACLEDRSSRPHHCPRLLSSAEQERICAARRRSGWGPRLVAGETGHPHATVWRALKRAGI